MQEAHDQRNQESITQMVNRLQRGHSHSGQYRGTEVTYSDPAILLRHVGGTTAIHTKRFVSIIEAG